MKNGWKSYLFLNGGGIKYLYISKIERICVRLPEQTWCYILFCHKHIMRFPTSTDWNSISQH